MYKKLITFLFIIGTVASYSNNEYTPFNKLSVKLYIDGVDNIKNSYTDDNNELVLNFKEYTISIITESCDVGFDSIDIDVIDDYKILDMYTIDSSTIQRRGHTCRISTKLSCHYDKHPYIHKYEGDERQYSITAEGKCYKGIKYEISMMKDDILLRQHTLKIGSTNIFDRHGHSNTYYSKYDL
ncbi:CPXV201 protein [Cowpox virus]|uniref:CPXV201 protein n=1 Tax=Cowpox virus TaxID=10243 RepID=A0A212QFG6_COWPX|nr:CPXV201 protein [Cowpox virus]